MGLRLPLQSGWAWLDKDTLEVEAERYDLSATEALEKFIDELNGLANTFASYRQFKQNVQDLVHRHERTMDTARREQPSAQVVSLRPAPKQFDPAEALPIKTVFGDLPPGIIPENWLKGRQYYDQGLPGPGHRAEAITTLSHYLFYGDPARAIEPLGYGCEQERQWLIAEILNNKHNNNSDDINKGRADALAQIERAAHWVPPHKRGVDLQPYTPKVPIAWTRNSANLKADARARIKAAVDELSAAGKPFSLRELEALAKTHHTTLKKHADLWRPAYDALQKDRFATASGEYNAVVGVVCPQNQPPSTAVSKNTPPGLLAARRIVFELNRRWDRQKRQKEKQEQQKRDHSEQSWRKSVQDAVPEDLSAQDVQALKALIAFLAWRLSLAPSEEDQLWVGEILTKVRTEFKLRATGPVPDNKHPP